MIPVIDHIHITVSDLARAEKFYDKLLPVLGFNLKNKEKDEAPDFEYEIIEYHHRNFSLGIVKPRSVYKEETVSRRKPGSIHHLAFHTGSCAEVDNLFSQIEKMKIKIIRPPRFYPEYCPDYYAFFFKDSEGIEYEVVSFNRKIYF